MKKFRSYCRSKTGGDESTAGRLGHPAIRSGLETHPTVRACLALATPSGDAPDEADEALVGLLHTLLTSLRRPGVLLRGHTCAMRPQGGIPATALCHDVHAERGGGFFS
jgi:hypothetical protein